MSCNKPEEDKDSDDESLEGVAVGSTGLYPCATGRESSDLQDSTRSGIVLNVEHLSEIANPSLVGRVDEQCLQIREDGEIRSDSVSEEEHEDSEGESLGCTEPCPSSTPTTGRDNSDLQDTTRSGIVLNVEEANPSVVERGYVQSECLQIREDEEICTDSVSEEEQSVPILSQISQNFTWDHFCYAFFFGLLPTAWDVLTDIQFKVSQEYLGLVNSLVGGSQVGPIHLPKAWFEKQ